MTVTLPGLTPDLAASFARIALGHVERPYPFKLDQVLLGPEDERRPAQLHPVFHGSFDWHSCVHGYWLLARIGRRFPQLPEAEAIAALFQRSLTPLRLARERAYLDRPLSGGFERPYGWAWLLALSAELERRTVPDERAWAEALRPLAAAFAAFPVMTAGVGLPLIVHRFGADPAAMAAIGMLSGFCGTLMTPMAANFNMVPAALLELDDRYAVIKAQIPTALILLTLNTALLAFLVLRTP